MSAGRSSPEAFESRTLLLIEDNQGDARLIEETLRQPVSDGLYAVSTGDEALDFVNRRCGYEDAPRPDLILLDWHLPGMGGEEVLATLNDDPDYDHIPVIVLTGSQSDAEIRESYRRNANACIAKTADPDELEETLRALETFWLSAARLPRAGDEA